MSGYVNIGVSNDDPTYRYKMPRLKTKIEGRGNGIKTVITNMVDVAKALHCSPAYPTKFFGVELGAQSKYDKETERSVVNGAHTKDDLATLLNRFIEIFVLCPNCRLPETMLEVKKGFVKFDCAACGHNGDLPTTHKLITYILKDPPAKPKKGLGSKKAGVTAAGASASVKTSKSKKSSKEDEVEWFTDASKEAQDARKAEELRSMGGTKDLVDRVDAIMIRDEEAAPVADKTPAGALHEFVVEEKSVPEIVSEIRRLALARGLTPDEQNCMIVDGVLDWSHLKTIPSQIASYKEVLIEFASNPMAERSLLAAFEKIIGVVHSSALPSTARILQALYDNDIIDEETIIEWYDSPPESSLLVSRHISLQLRDAAEPFIDWLANAEEDEDDDDDE